MDEETEKQIKKIASEFMLENKKVVFYRKNKNETAIYIVGDDLSFSKPVVLYDDQEEYVVWRVTKRHKATKIGMHNIVYLFAKYADQKEKINEDIIVVGFSKSMYDAISRIFLVFNSVALMLAYKVMAEKDKEIHELIEKIEEIVSASLEAARYDTSDLVSDLGMFLLDSTEVTYRELQEAILERIAQKKYEELKKAIDDAIIIIRQKMI